MKHLFLVEDEHTLLRYQRFVSAVQPRLDAYLKHLAANFAVDQLPNAILWTTRDIATRQISHIPVPAYTNDFRIVITPDIPSWQELYLSQLDALDPEDPRTARIRCYYSSKLTQNHILQILGHELAHHSSRFPEEAYETSPWFEEGMVEYISRTFFLTEEEFREEAEINQLLVDLLRPRYGTHPLEAFGSETYQGDYAGIFFAYWRSFLAVSEIVRRFGGDIQKVFQSYHQWCAASMDKPSLSHWFSPKEHPAET